MLPRGKEAGCSGCRCCLHRQPVPWMWMSGRFFFYLKCPLACNLGAGCYAEGGGKERKKRKRNSLPIATLIPESLGFSSSPSSEGSFPQKCLAKQKKVPLLLRGKQITPWLNGETHANPFSGVAAPHSSSFSRSCIHSSHQANQKKVSCSLGRNSVLFLTHGSPARRHLMQID